MTAIDWGIAGFALVLGIWGYRQGLIVAVLTMIGFASGALIGSRLGPIFLSEGARSPYGPLVAALAALAIGAVVAISVESIALDIREQVIQSRIVRALDGVGGAVLIASIALGLSWAFGAVALHAPSTVQWRSDLQRSLILSQLNDVLPPSGPLLNALSRVDPARPFSGPRTPVAPPRAALARDPAVLAAGPAVVRVLGTACGLGVEGSGWAARSNLVVTNAHVVAGQEDTTVVTSGGSTYGATPVHYDPLNDLAILRVAESLPALPMASDPGEGTAGAILGYPENGPYALTPARLGETRSVLSEDSYGRGPFPRMISFLRGRVRSGNSGGPMVDANGVVVSTIFAATTNGPDGGYAIPNEVVDAALLRSARPVDTGPCTG